MSPNRLILLLVAVIFAPDVSARIVTREEALRVAFPGAEIRYAPIFLTEQEMKDISKTSGTNPSTALIARYLAIQNAAEVGRGYLDTHVVRTKKESLLIILNPEGKVRRVEVVVFLEPPEYIPPDRWYQQFEGKSLTDGLRVEGEIHSVTGASLTAQATTDAVRRILAIDQMIRKKEMKQENQK